MDIVVIQYPDGELKSSSFHVRFGSLKVMNSKEEKIEIYINSNKTNVTMKLGSNGDAYFTHVISFNSQKINNNNLKLDDEIPLELNKIKSEEVKNNKFKQKQKTSKFFPTSFQLKQLKLKEGKNEICFMARTKENGIQTLKSFIYLWPITTKIIISDIDGTITKSDILGQIIPFIPFIGQNWCHDGVTELFSNIHNKGYEFIYLTSRAIGQSTMTKNYLNNLMQEEKSLPSGPLLMSPDGMLTSLKREVVEKKPHLLKIAVLNEIKNLFPEDINPFYAGFGNRETDGVAYRFSGIPLNNIYMVDKNHDVIQLREKESQKTSFKSLSLNDIINKNFPEIKREDNLTEKIFD